MLPIRRWKELDSASSLFTFLVSSCVGGSVLTRRLEINLFLGLLSVFVKFGTLVLTSNGPSSFYGLFELIISDIVPKTQVALSDRLFAEDYIGS